MNNWNISPDFEERVRQSFGAPDVSPEFVDHVYGDLMRLATSKPGKSRSSIRLRPAWAISLVILCLIFIGTLVIGPQRVFAAVGRLFGYIPGVGIVKDDESFRVLAEPVSITREGITLTVTDALLTSEKTVILYTLENIPWTALSNEENVVGCSGTAELHLPDGVIHQIKEGGGSMTQMRFVYPAIPPDVNDLKFVLPCIMNTLPGLAPENWILPLHFIPAPPDMKILPVVEIEVTPTALTNPPVAPEEPLSITKVLEIGDNYVIFGEFNPEKAKDASTPAAVWQLIDAITFTDGDGEEIYFTYPYSDIGLPEPSQPNAEVFAFQFSKSFTPPLAISYPGIFISKIGNVRNFEFEFDTGADPQPGQEWLINKDFTVDGYSVRLVSIIVGRDGYSFNFDHTEPANLFTEGAHVIGPESVEISGYTAVGGGGGGGFLSLAYADLPKGKLNVVITLQHYHSTHAKAFQVVWAPEMLTQPLYGISLKLDKFIPTANGFYLIGHTEWSDNRITNVTEYGAMRAFDADGRELDFKKAPFAEARTLVENLEPTQWVYQLTGNSFKSPITLRLEQVNVEFADPVRFALDLRPYGFTFADDQVGGSYKTGIQILGMPGLSASYFRARYLRNENYSGFEFALIGDQRLKNLALDFESGVANEQRQRIHEFRHDDEYKLLLITVLTDGQLSMPIGMIAHGADISGKWETTWSPEMP